MSTTRIYVVIHGDERRLIEATSASQAIRHCVEPRYIARPATPKDVAQLTKYGITVEQAGIYSTPEIPETATTGQTATN